MGEEGTRLPEGEEVSPPSCVSGRIQGPEEETLAEAMWSHFLAERLDSSLPLSTSV